MRHRIREVRLLVPGSLELEEVWVAGQQQGAVEDLAGLLATRYPGQHRPEKGHPVHVNVGVPTSSPTGAMPASWLARSSSSYSVLCAAAASSAGRPTSSSAAAITASRSLLPSLWIRLPMAV